MVSVLWSDEAEVIIYRSFPDFRKFHVRKISNENLINHQTYLNVLK